MVCVVAKTENNPAIVSTDAKAKESKDIGATFAILRQSLRNYIRKYVNDADIVDDVLQDIFIKALITRNAKGTPENLTGWLYAVARTTIIDFYRSKPRNTVELDDRFLEMQILEMQNTDHDILYQELAMCLRPLVQQLPKIYSETLIATDFEGKTMQMLADEYDLSLSAIKSRASRARVMLKAKLLECCHVEISDDRITDYYFADSNASYKACC